MPAEWLLKRIAIAVSVVLLAATVFALVSADGGLEEMTLERLRGDVSVLRAGEVLEVDDRLSIEPGDSITTGAGGRAELRLEGLRRVELAPDSMVIVADTTAVEGRRGSLLASSGGTDGISVRFGRVEGTTTDGRFRVDLGAGSSRLGVYEGGAVITSPGESDASVDRYFQASVAGNDRVLESTPLVLEREDAWDRIHLSEVLALDERITKLGNGFSTQLGGARPGLGYFSGLTNGPVGFLRDYVDDERVQDLVIGLTIAKNSPAPLGSTFTQAFEYRDQDGSWGLIAYILEAHENGLVAELGKTILETGILAADVDDIGAGFGPDSEGTAAPVAPGGGDSTTGPDTSPGDGGGDDGPGDGGDDQNPSPSPPPDESECGPQDPVACLEDLPLGDELLGDEGLLGEQGPLD
ncbi:MAG: hypothetical protein ACRDJB_00470 [Actinomycetota bacterium]